MTFVFFFLTSWYETNKKFDCLKRDLCCPTLYRVYQWFRLNLGRTSLVFISYSLLKQLEKWRISKWNWQIKLCLSNSMMHMLEQGWATIFVRGSHYSFISVSRATFQSKRQSQSWKSSLRGPYVTPYWIRTFKQLVRLFTSLIY